MGADPCSDVGWFHPFKRCRHLLMHEVHRLQGSNHHTELDDASLYITADDVDTVDVLALHRGLELKNSGIFAQHLFRVMETSGRSSTAR